MNTAFGNPKGDYNNIDWTRILNQCKNLFDEYCELLEALGIHSATLGLLKLEHNLVLSYDFTNDPQPLEVRDALADIQVFKDGALHMMGVDGDADMHAVVDGVLTRFIKDEADREATMAMHAKKGVTSVTFEGDFPKMVMKSTRDQPDAPKGKFLKSASYRNTIFPEVK